MEITYHPFNCGIPARISRYWLKSLIFFLSLFIFFITKSYAQDQRSLSPLLMFKSEGPIIYSLDSLHKSPKATNVIKDSVFFTTSTIQVTISEQNPQSGRILRFGKSKDFGDLKNDKVYFKVFDPDGREITDDIGAILLAPDHWNKTNLLRREGFIYAGSFAPGESRTIHFYDNQSDTLVQTLYVARMKHSPLITAYWVTGQSIFFKGITKKTFVKNRQQTNTVSLYPTQTLTLPLDVPHMLLDSMEISYSIINNKDNGMVNGTAIGKLELKELQASSQYTLKIWYTNYQDTQDALIILIKVKPHWYQSTIFYLLIASLFAFMLFYRIFKKASQKTKRNLNEVNQQFAEKEQELRMIHAQLNPHFIFNSMSSIQSLINTDRVEQANQYLTTFSLLLRNALERSTEKWSSLRNELDLLRHYLQLEQLRFGFDYEIYVDPSLDPSEIKTPTMLLQPLVENAVIHGVSVLEGHGKIKLACLRSANDLVIEIQDNGKGLTSGDEKGYGIRLTKKRIRVLNEMHKESLILLDFKNESGMLVTLRFQHLID